MPRTQKQLNDDIGVIAKAINDAKVKTIKRINKQLERMSPKDVQALERLIGSR